KAQNTDGETKSLRTQSAQSAAAFIAVLMSADVNKGRVMRRNEKLGLFTMLLIRQLVTPRLSGPPRAIKHRDADFSHFSCFRPHSLHTGCQIGASDFTSLPV
ncbi:uncharacterized, partial [Tachysurus ichikawai]